MSYFMIAVGPKPDLASLPKVEAMAVRDAQEYVQRVIPILVPAIPPPTVWFIHDGETGTSHNFIMTSQEQVQMESVPVSSTLLWKIILACEKAGDSFLIWWAGGELEVEKCTSIKSVMDTIIRQTNGGDDILIRYEHTK